MHKETVAAFIGEVAFGYLNNAAVVENPIVVMAGLEVKAGVR
jgi:hypothetical protein